MVQKVRKMEETSLALPNIYSIWICNFELLKDTTSYRDEWSIYSKNHLEAGKKTPVFEKNKYILIELPKFKKKVSQLDSAEDTWIYLLKNLREKQPKLPPSAKSETALSEALDRIRICEANSELIKKQEAYMVDQEEIDTRLYDSYHAGLAEGLKKMAKAMKDDNVPSARIAAYSGLPEEIIKAL